MTRGEFVACAVSIPWRVRVHIRGGPETAAPSGTHTIEQVTP